MCRCLDDATALDGLVKLEDLEPVRQRIKELEAEKTEHERMEKLSAACKTLKTASASLPQSVPVTFDSMARGTKRTWDDFEEVVKHAQTVLDLHKKFKKEESTGREKVRGFSAPIDRARGK